jgi:hypothetical protein
MPPPNLLCPYVRDLGSRDLLYILSSWPILSRRRNKAHLTHLLEKLF